MPLGLLKYGLGRRYRPDPIFTKPGPLKSSYDVVIIGAGGHGLAAAYYAAKSGASVLVLLITLRRTTA